MFVVNYFSKRESSFVINTLSLNNELMNYKVIDSV